MQESKANVSYEAKSESEANPKGNHDFEDNQDDEANLEELLKEWRFHHDHPQENLLTEPSEKVVTRSGRRKIIGNVAFVSQIETKIQLFP